MPEFYHNRRRFVLASLTAILATRATTGDALAQTTPESSDALWASLKPDVFGDKAIAAGSEVIQVVAPKRAQDAGLVPVDIKLDPGPAKAAIKKVTLIIDANPSPVAATFTLGDGAGIGTISTRVRVNDYSYVRAIAETSEGELHMAQTFVKATGGCSTPAAKNPEEAKASMGQMKLRQFVQQASIPKSARRDVQLMIRHPNHSGFQMDQVTRYFIPPHFVNDVRISQDGVLVLRMEGGISISEDPNFRFDFVATDGSEIEVEATDTEGKSYRSKWPLEAAGL